MENYWPIYYDAEFTGLHKDTSLISVGLVTKDFNMFYGICNDYDKSQVDDWLEANVIKNLAFNDKEIYYHKEPTHDFRSRVIIIKDTRENVRIALLKWLDDNYKYSRSKIQLYCDCYAYDIVLFNDLVCENGNGLNLPDNIYYIPFDLSTALQIHGIDPDIDREEFVKDELEKLKEYGSLNQMKHNALYDAIVSALCFNKLGYENKISDIM